MNHKKNTNRKKILNLILFIALIFTIVSCQTPTSNKEISSKQENRIELPLTWRKGYGPLAPGISTAVIPVTLHLVHLSA